MKNYQRRLVLSRELKYILNKIGDSISRKLIFLDNNGDYGFSFSYIDITSKGDTISFTPSKKVIDLFNNVPRADKVIWHTSRNEQKIGRFVSKITGENSKNIESFVNSFKAEIKIYNNMDNFGTIEGADIPYYYHGKTYSSGGGSLNKSCMRHDHCQDYFEFYAINPTKVKLIVLYESKRKNVILGRALLWSIDEPKINLLDRVYTSNDSDARLFLNYAKKSNWYYKKSQRFDEPVIVDPDGNDTELKCKIFLKEHEHKYFPYLDTFYFYDKKDNYITNDLREYKENKNIVRLRSTDGREQGNDNFVFDYYNNDTVKVVDTIYCEIGDTRTLKNDSISINGKYAIPSMIRFSEYDGKVYTKNDVVWSTTHKTFINKKLSFKVYFDDDKIKYDYIHSDFKGENFDYVHDRDSYFIKDLIIKGIDDNFYLKNYYDEDKVKKLMSTKNKLESAEDLNRFFDEFIKTLSKSTIDVDYGTFGSTLI